MTPTGKPRGRNFVSQHASYLIEDHCAEKRQYGTTVCNDKATGSVHVDHPALVKYGDLRYCAFHGPKKVAAYMREISAKATWTPDPA